jgi:hypothetical protein
MRSRVSRGTSVLLALTGLSLGALANVARVEVAKAYHYHQACNEHGMVHGGSTGDAIYHGRWREGPCKTASYCMAGQFHDAPAAIQYVGAGTCDVILRQYGPECAGYGQAVPAGAPWRHHHQAHNPCWPPFEDNKLYPASARKRAPDRLNCLRAGRVCEGRGYRTRRFGAQEVLAP